MRQLRFLNKLLFLCLLFILISCVNTGFINNGYDILKVSQQTYDFNLKLAGDLYREGKITESQKEEVIKIGNGYMTAHNGAVESLAVYRENSGSKNAVMEAISNASKSLSELIKYIRGLL